jgi:acyl carrier protein
VTSMPRLIKVFREVFDDDTLLVKDETTAKEVPGWDSLTHVSLIVAVESEFGIRFSSGEINALKNVGELRRLVEQKLG